MLKDELQKFAHKVVEEAQRNLIDANKVASGKLYDSIEYNVSGDENKPVISFEMESYGEAIDKGAKFTNKMPPLQSILDWVKLKGLRLRDEKGQFKKGGQRSLAFLIQRSVFEKGIKPTLFFTKPFEKHFKGLDNDVAKIVANQTEDLIDG